MKKSPMEESKLAGASKSEYSRRQMVDQCKAALKTKMILEKKRYATRLTIDVGTKEGKEADSDTDKSDDDSEDEGEDRHSDASTISSVSSFSPMMTPGSQTVSTLMVFPSPLPKISDDEWSVSTTLIDEIPLYSPAFTVGTLLSPVNGNEHKVLWELDEQILENVKYEDQYSDMFPFADSHLRLKFSLKSDKENVVAIEIMLARCDRDHLIEAKLKLEMNHVHAQSAEAKYLKFSSKHESMELVCFELNHLKGKGQTTVAITLYN